MLKIFPIFLYFWLPLTGFSQKIIDPDVVLDKDPVENSPKNQKLNEEENSSNFEQNSLPSSPLNKKFNLKLLGNGAFGDDAKIRKQRQEEMAKSDLELAKLISQADENYQNTFRLEHSKGVLEREKILTQLISQLRIELEIRSKNIDRVCSGRMNIPVGNSPDQLRQRQNAMALFTKSQKNWQIYFDLMKNELIKRNIHPGLIAGWEAEQLKLRLAHLGNAHWHLNVPNQTKLLKKILPQKLKDSWKELPPAKSTQLKDMMKRQSKEILFLTRLNIEFLQENANKNMVQKTQAAWKAYHETTSAWDLEFGMGFERGLGDPTLSHQAARLIDRMVVLNITKLNQTYLPEKTKN